MASRAAFAGLKMKGHICQRNGQEVLFDRKDGGRQRFNRTSHPLVGSLKMWAAEVIAIVLVLGSARSAAAQIQIAPGDSGAAPVLIVGFMGGFVHPNDLRHSEAQIARRIQNTYGDHVQVQMFKNRQRGKAHQWILDRLGGNDNPQSIGEEERTGRIILFGHSWGASAAIYLARELERDGVPVSLTIQVDSITKNGQDDSVIPANVAEAMNFYQPRGILHGRSAITAADPSRTRILGNVRFTYEKAPLECRAYPWYDRLLFKGHTAIECDPHVWSQVETLIRMQLPDVSQSAQSVVATRVVP